MKVCILSKARCAANLIDNSKLRDYFNKNNFKITSSPKDADLILINTCAFSQKSENDSIDFIKKIEKQKKNNSQIIVFGCLVSINKERLRREFKGLILSHKELSKIDDIIKAHKNFSEIKSNFLQPEILKQTGKNKQIIWKVLNFLNKTKIFSFQNLKKILYSGFDFSSSAYYIQISEGCLGACSYCAIRYARGRIKSKSIKEITEEINFGISKGYKDFILVAEDVGAYGKDIGTDFNSLLLSIESMRKNIRLYIYQLNPEWVINNTEFLIRQIKKNNIVFLCIPIQSGSDRILRLMNRGYGTEAIKDSIKDIKKRCPDTCIASHFMVGFPGETESEFQDTLNFIKEMKFDSMAVFRFGARPNTPAAIMPNPVSEKEKLERLKKAERTIFLTRLKSLKIPINFSN